MATARSATSSAWPARPRPHHGRPPGDADRLADAGLGHRRVEGSWSPYRVGSTAPAELMVTPPVVSTGTGTALRCVGTGVPLAVTTGVAVGLPADESELMPVAGAEFCAAGEVFDSGPIIAPMMTMRTNTQRIDHSVTFAAELRVG